MTYDPTAHKAQMSILRCLLLNPSAAFNILQKETGLSSDHFNFHLQKLLQEKMIQKNSQNEYILTKAGKEYANRMDTDRNIIEKQPKLSVALIIENDEGKFLAQKRLKQPFYGFWGRPTGKIGWGEELLEAGARELMEETGLTAELNVGGFYHKMDYDKETGQILEDKYFCLIYGKNPEGGLIEKDEGHENAWMSDNELEAQEKVFDTVREITELASSKELGFLEQKYTYRNDEY